MTDNDDSILHDFSDQTLKVSMYGGAPGKRTMDYHGHRYMVKFGCRPDRTGHADCPVSEFIGSKVFAAADIPTQHVLLGTYRGQPLVACRDFMEGLDPSWRLVHFRQLAIGMPGESGRSKARPDWEFVRHVLTDSPDLAPIRQAAWDRFRRMICVDALIGNDGRLSDDWGYIADGGANIVALAPVYDCGSSLMPHLSEDEMRARLDDPALMRQANIDSPAMAMNVRGKRRKYGYFLVFRRPAGHPRRPARPVGFAPRREPRPRLLPDDPAHEKRVYPPARPRPGPARDARCAAGHRPRTPHAASTGHRHADTVHRQQHAAHHARLPARRTRTGTVHVTRSGTSGNGHRAIPGTGRPTHACLHSMGIETYLYKRRHRPWAIQRIQAIRRPTRFLTLYALSSAISGKA